MWKFLWTYKLLIVLALGLVYLVGSIMFADPIYRCGACNSQMVEIKEINVDRHGHRTYGMRCPKCDIQEIRRDTDCPYIIPSEVLTDEVPAGHPNGPEQH